MLNANAEHQRTTTTILRNLACGIAIALHEWNQTCRSQRRIVHRRTFRTYVAKVMTYSTTTLHQLHLLFVNTHDSAIRVGIAIKTNNEAVAKACHLMMVANTCHRATSRNNISEMIEQLEYLLLRKRVRIFLLYAGYLISNTPMHILRRAFKDCSKTIFHGILVDPYSGSKFIAIKVLQRSLISFLIGKSLF